MSAAAIVRDSAGNSAENQAFPPIQFQAVKNPTPSSARKRFPKSGRLLKHADFERVYKLGRRHFAQHMTVFYLDREGENGARFGFTVSKALGEAVQRNRMKRRLREAVRLVGLERDLPVDIVINPKRTLLKAQFADLREEILRAVEMIGKNFRNNSAKVRGRA